MNSYPRREPFHAHRYTRLLFKTCAVMDVGTEGVLLCIHIAHTEDAARYCGPVRFWNSQLSETLGFRSPKQLQRARDAAVRHGWLVYHRTHDRSVGQYFTIIPRQFVGIGDTPIEPIHTQPNTGSGSVSIPLGERETERESEQKEECEATQECPTRRPGNVSRTDPPSYPNPIPKPNPNKNDSSNSKPKQTPPPQPHRTLKEKLDARGVPADIDYSKCGEDMP